MDLPGTETEGATHRRRSRQLLVGVALVVMVLGLVGVAPSAFAGHDTPRVVATAAAPPVDPSAHPSDTTSIVVHPIGVYSVPSSTCAPLAPGQSCAAKIQFCPNSPSHYLDTLMVTGQDATSGSPLLASITLNGIAT